MTQQIQFADRADRTAIESGDRFSPKFDADGLIPAIAIDADSCQPLMLAYMNAESLRRTLESGEAVYWSRSRQEIWHKGASSGHVQQIVEILTDCDQDALVLKVRQKGAGACHTGHRSCFYRRLTDPGADGVPVLQESDDGLAFNPDSVYG